MHSLLQSVAQRGTGARTNVLKRGDLAGKTGTTNDSHDAWFAGYQHTLAAIAWIGYDNPRSLGDRETGGGLAVPVWIEYMGAALKDVPEFKPTMPDGVETLGSELYFTDFTPGHGFVSTVGVPQAPAAQSFEEPAPAHVDEQEKQDIMNLFRGH
jgi:penicillin-binding protein 1A